MSRTSSAEAVLVLEDGRAFRGEAYGAVGETFGEAVFATGMTGYQETLTDPSYHGQVVVQTAPHIGNTGVNDEDPESGRIWVAGYVVRDPSRVSSSWRATRTLDDELADQGVVGISGIDTRALTRHLRERGAMRVGVSSVDTDVDALLERVKASPTMVGANLTADVTTPRPYVVEPDGEARFTVVAVDLGIKAMTPRRMAERGMRVHVVPAGSSLADVTALSPDGVFFSNGPGDPAAADDAVDLMRGVLAAGLPVFGICFGNQVFGRALGLGTYKLRFGHRGINQPVQDRTTGKVEVTRHNLRPHLQRLIERCRRSFRRVRIMDIGCGSADGFELLAGVRDRDADLKQMEVDLLSSDMLGVYTGVDLNEDLLRQAADIHGTNPKIHFKQADFTAGLPLEDGEEPYDLYFSS